MPSPLLRRAALTLGAIIALATAPFLPAAAQPITILAFGDSLVHGFGLAQGDSFPAQLEAALTAEGQPVRVVNAGNSGDTSAAGLARLDWSLAEAPDAAIVVLGANDGLRGLEPGETYANLERILATLEARQVPTLLAGMKAPRNLGPEYVAAFDGLYPRLAAAHDVVFYPFFLEGVATEAALNQADGIHPNAQGVAEIVRRLLPDVRLLLQRTRETAAGKG